MRSGGQGGMWMNSDGLHPIPENRQAYHNQVERGGRACRVDWSLPVVAALGTCTAREPRKRRKRQSAGARS
eukprot:747573-Hanusia_phi.AAC.3